MGSAAACRICPNRRCEGVGNYNPSGKVTLTCTAETLPDQCLDYCLKPDAAAIDNNQPYRQPPQWYKTINNCYIEAASVQGGKMRCTELEICVCILT
jgi:hypothetical protein